MLRKAKNPVLEAQDFLFFGIAVAGFFRPPWLMINFAKYLLIIHGRTFAIVTLF